MISLKKIQQRFLLLFFKKMSAAIQKKLIVYNNNKIIKQRKINPKFTKIINDAEKTGLYIRYIDFYNNSNHGIASLSSKNQKKTLIFLHGLGSSGAEWDPIIKKLNNRFNIITVDFLGFGCSARPNYIYYGEHTEKLKKCLQILQTELGFKNPIIIGNSLGSLFTLDIYQSLNSKKIILLSPPISKPFFKNREDRELQKAYKKTLKNPRLLPFLSQLGELIKIVPTSMQIDDTNLSLYVQTFREYILGSKNYYWRLKNINISTKIVIGLIDPLINNGYMKEISKNPNVKIYTTNGMHGVLGKNMDKLLEILNDE